MTRSLHTPGLAKCRHETVDCPHCDGSGRDSFERSRTQLSPYLVDGEQYCDVCRNEGKISLKIARLYEVGGLDAVRDWDGYLFGAPADWSKDFQPRPEPREPHRTSLATDRLWFNCVYSPWLLHVDHMGKLAYAALIKRYSGET